MAEFSKELESLRVYFLKKAKWQEERIDLFNVPNLSPAEKDEQAKAIDTQIEFYEKGMRRVLRELLENPPQHVRHQVKLPDFYQAAEFEKSVFVMTKFPDPLSNAAADLQLKAVIQAVRDAVQACGFTARLANDRNFHPLLWDNVELHLLGSKRGIAIVEDKYLSELNPNVTMEWGWMRGMGRNVLYLVERGFDNQRADLSGLTKEPFDWTTPAAAIGPAVQAWLRP